MALAKIDSITSDRNFLNLQRHPRRPTIQSGRNMLVESVQICENVVFASAKEISRFLRKLDKVVMVRSSLLRRRTLVKSVH